MDGEIPNSERDRFNLRLGAGKRDRVIAAWMDWLQHDQGMDVSETVKNILFEQITGTSCLTGRPIVIVQGDVPPSTRPPMNEPDNPVAQALMGIDD